MTLTALEAKEKCIKMWEHIEENITDKVWRDAAMAASSDGAHDTLGWDVKTYTLNEIFPVDEPRHNCFLCSLYFIAWLPCEGECPLRDEEKGTHCEDDREPYASFLNNCMQSHYARAAKAAHRLVEKVRAWEVE